MKSISFRVCSTSAEQVVELMKQANQLLKGLEFSSLALACSMSPTFPAEQFAEMKKDVQAVLNRNLAEQFAVPIQFEHSDVFLRADFPSRTLFLEIKPVFVYGHYNKFQRGIAQTYHYCRMCKGRGCTACKGLGKVSDESVQELITPLLVQSFGGEELIFHGSGREDADVRMLGKGRPFIAEITEPAKRQTNLSLIEQTLNESFSGKIAVHGLRLADKKEVPIVKHPGHEKRYEALVETNVTIAAKEFESILVTKKGVRLDVDQFTPERVEKRRAALTRKHYVTIESFNWLSEKNFTLILRTSPGCYVKEFISGDSGRSKPSISELIHLPCFCKELDVIEIIES